ncbi:MAG: serine/threonine-protein kinase [Myxococcota bacterium]
MHEPRKAGDKIDGMEVVRVIGEGGFGRVYAVRHGDGIQALKVMTVDATHDQNLRLRFEREAEVIRRLKSEYVPEVYELGTLADGSPFIRMELLVGRSLAEVLRENGKLPWRRVVRLGVQACRALAVAHDAGVLHRDLKPDNLFLVGAGEDERVKVLDFGVATFVPGYTDRHGALTHTSAIVGTPHYMSPEQVRSGELAPSSDVYMVGVVLYEMLTGKRPFFGDNLGLLLSAILSGRYTPIERLANRVPRVLIGVVDKAMSFDASLRYQSAEAMAEALEPAEAAKSEAPPTLAGHGFDDAAATALALPSPADLRPSANEIATRIAPVSSVSKDVVIEKAKASQSPGRSRRVGGTVIAGLVLMAIGIALGYAAVYARSHRPEREAPAPIPPGPIRSAPPTMERALPEGANAPPAAPEPEAEPDTPAVPTTPPIQPRMRPTPQPTPEPEATPETDPQPTDDSPPPSRITADGLLDPFAEQ